MGQLIRQSPKFG